MDVKWFEFEDINETRIHYITRLAIINACHMDSKPPVDVRLATYNYNSIHGLLFIESMLHEPNTKAIFIVRNLACCEESVSNDKYSYTSSHINNRTLNVATDLNKWLPVINSNHGTYVPYPTGYGTYNPTGYNNIMLTKCDLSYLRSLIKLAYGNA